MNKLFSLLFFLIVFYACSKCDEKKLLGCYTCEGARIEYFTYVVDTGVNGYTINKDTSTITIENKPLCINLDYDENLILRYNNNGYNEFYVPIYLNSGNKFTRSDGKPVNKIDGIFDEKTSNIAFKYVLEDGSKYSRVIYNLNCNKND